MSEWEETTLGEIADVTMGQSPSSNQMNNSMDGVPFLQGNRTFGHLYPTFDTWTTSPTKTAEENDVIMSVRAPVGDINITPVKMCLGRGVCSIRMNNGNQRFLYYLMRYYAAELIRQENGTVFGSVNRTDIKSLRVVVPDAKHQRRIAAVLSALDDKIELNNRVNANLEVQAQALFRSWFVDFEPWGREMPETWREGKLEEIAEIIMGQSPPGTALNEQHDGTPFFQGRAEFGTRYPFERLYTTETTRSALEGDVLLSVRAPVGDLNIAMSDCCIGRGLAALRSRFNHASFLFYLLKDMRPAFDVFDQQGTIFGCIGKKDLHGLDIVVPDGKTLDHFQQIAGPLDLKILINEMQNRTLASLRDALLPKLMRGEIDVEKVEVAG